METILALASLLVIFACAWLRLGYILFESAAKPNSRERTQQDTSAFLERIGYEKNRELSLYKGFGEVELINSSFASHKIPIEIIFPNISPCGIVVLAHGYTADRTYWYPMLSIYLKRGYICVLYDQRNTAGNTAELFTFGFLEKYDLKDVVDYAKATLDASLPLVVHGVSLGGATVGFYLQEKFEQSQGVACAIMDCPFSTINDAFAVYTAKKYKFLPIKLILPAGSLWNYLSLKFWYHQGSVIKAVADAECPVLVIYSDEDTVCPGWQGQKVFEAVPLQYRHELHFASGQHARLQFDQAEAYEAGIADFLAKNA